jgi:hypothetical protein
MTETFILMLKLVVVSGIQTGGNSTLLQFQDGQKGALSASLKDYSYYLELARRSLDRKQPVGVSLNRENGSIGEMARADNDFVAEVQDSGGEKLRVFFKGHDGIFSVRRDHPDFQRVLGVLKNSEAAGTRVWFVARKPALLIEDAITLPADEAEPKNKWSDHPTGMGFPEASTPGV